jgi:hypothetical protein
MKLQRYTTVASGGIQQSAGILHLAEKRDKPMAREAQ